MSSIFEQLEVEKLDAFNYFLSVLTKFNLSSSMGAYKMYRDYKIRFDVRDY